METSEAHSIPLLLLDMQLKIETQSQQRKTMEANHQEN